MILALRRYARASAVFATLLIVGAVAAPLYFRSNAAPAAHAVDNSIDNSGLSLYQLTSTWTTDDNRAVKLPDLRGHCQILALIFTHCSGTCPLTVKELEVFAASLHARLKDQTRFVLVTIDPADSSDDLRRYRETMKLNDHWMLLRGSTDSVRELAATLGFSYQPQGDQFAHSNLITVLDAQGVIVHQQPGVGGNRRDLLSAVERAVAQPRVKS